MVKPERNTINALSKNSIFRLLYELVSTISSNAIVMPDGYYNSVVETKKLLRNDFTGLVNTMLDFAIGTFKTEYVIETGNSNFDKVLNNWLQNINAPLRGKIPVGIKSLSGEYARERWKGSSLCLLRSLWSEQTIDRAEYFLPNRMWFVAGEDIIVDSADNDKKIIGAETYALQVGKSRDNKDDRINLPVTNYKAGIKEEIFVQKPFSGWTDEYTVPFLILRGLYKNMKMIELIENKSGSLVSKAIEYFAMIKKGTERLFLDGNIAYDEPKLKDIKERFQNVMGESANSKSSPVNVTQFDTDFSHIIPEYEKILKHDLRVTYERNILGGLGLIEILEGVGTSRKEAIFSPKPFITEIENGISDFENLLIDVVEVIKEKNKDKHIKFMNSDVKVYSRPVKAFLTKDLLDHIRSAYDRGMLSKETYTEICTPASSSIEIRRREAEDVSGINDILYPPVIQNNEKDPDAKKNIQKDEKTDTTKTSIEKKNFNMSEEEMANAPWETNSELPNRIKQELTEEEQTLFREFFNQAIKSHDCVIALKLTNRKMQSYYEQEIIFANQEGLESAPYNKIRDLPDNVKNVLPAPAQKLWLKTFNENYKKNQDDDSARKTAWYVVKLTYKKSGDKWVKKKATEVKSSLEELDVAELLEIKKLEVLSKQEKLINELLAETEEGKPNETSE